MTVVLEGAASPRDETPLSLLGQAVQENDLLRAEVRKLTARVESQRVELAELRTSNLLLLNAVQVDTAAFDLLCGPRRGRLHSVRVD